MVWSFFKSSGTPVAEIDPASQPMPDSKIDILTYAIGDIHGRYDLFKALIAAIRADAMKTREKPRIVLLGDYIDRGPDSAKVISAILDLQKATWCETEALLGNHELFMIKFALDITQGQLWLRHGGLSTIASYGMTAPKGNNPEQWKALQDELFVKVPKSHLTFLSQAKISLIAGDYLFVHGGVEPGVPLEEQGIDTMLWIRDKFLSSPRACDYVVVHGHSATLQADNLPWRIGVDTGAYATGILTAIRLKGADRQLMQVNVHDVSLARMAG